MENKINVISKLASSLNRRDEVPNQELAKQIVKKKEVKAVNELVENLSNRNKAIQQDCIKVLYEIGEREPRLIAGYFKEFLELLASKNNRLQWGAMAALNTIALENPRQVYNSLSKITAVAAKGSVITKDNCFFILIKLCSQKQYAEKVFPLLLEHLLGSPANQFPLYAEQAIPLITEKNKKPFVGILLTRLEDMEKESKRKRVEKVIKKFSK